MSADRLAGARRPAAWPAATRGLATAALLLAGTASAAALSEIQREELSPPLQDEARPGTVPTPDPPVLPRDAAPADEESAPPADAAGKPAAPVQPEVIYDLDRLPEPVRRLHGLIVEACRSGDLAALRPLLGSGETATTLSFGGPVDDPIAFLREVSGDQGGQEILAILLEVLQAGYVHLDAGTPAELYVWPYFFALPLDGLTDRQRVELFTLVTAGDYEDMKNFGAYIFYRVGITPEGRWVFFVAGD